MNDYDPSETTLEDLTCEIFPYVDGIECDLARLLSHLQGGGMPGKQILAHSGESMVDRWGKLLSTLSDARELLSRVMCVVGVPKRTSDDVCPIPNAAPATSTLKKRKA